MLKQKELGTFTHTHTDSIGERGRQQHSAIGEELEGNDAKACAYPPLSLGLGIGVAALGVGDSSGWLGVSC